MKDLKQLLMEAGYESREDKQKARDEKKGAMDKDKLFKMAYQNNKEQYYQIKGIIDAISRDSRDPNVKIVSLNSIRIRINGKEYIANHTHLRGDKVKLDCRWKKGQEVVLNVKIRRYSHGSKDKYELVNIF